MPKKSESKPLSIKVENKIQLPSVYQTAAADKYKFSQLKEIGMSVFISLEGQNERNLRQNIFQHMKRAKDKWGMDLTVRTTTLDPDDLSSPAGFRVWRVKQETKKKR